MKYTHILFDADETLLDFSQAEAFALSEALKHEGITCTDEVAQAYKSINFGPNTNRGKSARTSLERSGLNVCSASWTLPLAAESARLADCIRSSWGKLLFWWKARLRSAGI